jgi:hypothetical protein
VYGLYLGGAPRTSVRRLFCIVGCFLGSLIFPQVCVEVSAMKFPVVGQRVTVDGQDDVYLVVRVDLRRYAADLMLMTGTHHLEQNIPFRVLATARQKTVRPREESEVS